MYNAKTGNFTCPCTYPYVHLNIYLEEANIPPCSQDFRSVFRSRRYDKRSKENVLSSKPLSPQRAREILKEKLEAIVVDSLK